MKSKTEQQAEDAIYLRDLAERLMHVPAMYGTDQSDTDTLHEIAGRLETPNKSKEQG